MKTMRTILVLLFLTFALGCTTENEQTDNPVNTELSEFDLQQYKQLVAEGIVNPMTNQVIEAKKPVACEFVFPDECDYDFVIARLNNETGWSVYSRFLEFNGFFGFTVANFPCDACPYCFSHGNGQNFYDDVVWRWELYNEQDEKVDEGCFQSICYATNVKLKRKIKSGNYYLKFIDFPEVTTQFNVIIP